jgi:hypothetical protein
LRGATDIDDVESIWLDTDAGPKRARLILKKLLRDGAGAIPQPRNRPLRELRQATDVRDGQARVSPRV